MSFMDPSREATSTEEQGSIREWGSIGEDGSLQHSASCRRCGEKVSSHDAYGPIKVFKEMHTPCEKQPTY